MAKAHAKKKLDVINELCQHSSLIKDEKVKNYIMKQKEKKSGIHRKQIAIESSAEEEDVEMNE